MHSHEARPKAQTKYTKKENTPPYRRTFTFMPLSFEMVGRISCERRVALMLHFRHSVRLSLQIVAATGPFRTITPLQLFKPTCEMNALYQKLVRSVDVQVCGPCLDSLLGLKREPAIVCQIRQAGERCVNIGTSELPSLWRVHSASYMIEASMAPTSISFTANTEKRQRTVSS